MVTDDTESPSGRRYERLHARGGRQGSVVAYDFGWGRSVGDVGFFKGRGSESATRVLLLLLLPDSTV